MKNRLQLSATNFSMLHGVFMHEFTSKNFDRGWEVVETKLFLKYDQKRLQEINSENFVLSRIQETSI